MRDAERNLGLPGIGTVLGARILSEFGDDRHRYTDAKAGRNYAGTSPIHPGLRRPPRGARVLRPQPTHRRRRASVGVLRHARLTRRRLAERLTSVGSVTKLMSHADV